MKQHELGFFGNIWVRQNELQTIGETFNGHKHKFDHVTLLVSGKVSVEIEGHPQKEFIAPTFIVVRKEHRHKITALTGDVVYYCVFALRDVDGEIMDIFGPQHDPESASGVPDNYWDKVKTLENT